jgi:hypothetical protein
MGLILVVPKLFGIKHERPTWNLKTNEELTYHFSKINGVGRNPPSPIVGPCPTNLKLKILGIYSGALK